MSKIKKFALALLGVMVVLVTAGCLEEETAQRSQRETRQTAYEKASKKQPPKTMDYSPSRATMNRWIETWDEPGKLAYVYLQNMNGELTGYYVFDGPPVSYCASLTPNYDIIKEESAPDHIVPAPSMDHVYYGPNAGCNMFYGFDATTGAYMEFFAGAGISPLTYDRPLPLPDIEPRGFTKIEDVK